MPGACGDRGKGSERKPGGHEPPRHGDLQVLRPEFGGILKKLIRGDGDLSAIAHYVSKGQNLRELINMTPLEWAFLRAAWELELEYIKEAMVSGK